MKTSYLYGTISHGTLRSEDLIPEFCTALRTVRGSVPQALWQRAFACLHSKERMEEDGMELVAELTMELENYAAPYHYFGTHPGDGSDFGFWLNDDFQQLMKDDGVLFVSDTAEVPANYTGTVLHMNDHGNPSFYRADNGRMTKIWSQV